ncbi:MAG: hypothetical protein ACTHWF_04265 [Brachybacterium sp.]
MPLLEDISLDRVCWSMAESILYSLHRGTDASAWDGECWRKFDLP